MIIIINQFQKLYNQNNMNPLLTFASAFLAMAAADQDHIIAALLLMCVSVYFFLKSLPNEQDRGL
jgi:putative Mn2+ efflux pump MntP